MRSITNELNLVLQQISQPMYDSVFTDFNFRNNERKKLSMPVGDSVNTSVRQNIRL